MTDKDLAAVQRELAELRARVAHLENETAAAEPLSTEWTRRYYLTYYATTGFFLGMIAALASLLVNVVGSLGVGQHPLQLIRVYLTFGLGERALELQLDKGHGGLALIIGVCLYIATGMLLGVFFQVTISRFADQATLMKRLAIADCLGPRAVGRKFLPTPVLDSAGVVLAAIGWSIRISSHPGVAALTHLVFGWTMAVIYPWGMYEPYRVLTE